MVVACCCAEHQRRSAVGRGRGQFGRAGILVVALDVPEDSGSAVVTLSKYARSPAECPRRPGAAFRPSLRREAPDRRRGRTCGVALAQCARCARRSRLTRVVHHAHLPRNTESLPFGTRRGPTPDLRTVGWAFRRGPTPGSAESAPYTSNQVAGRDLRSIAIRGATANGSSSTWDSPGARRTPRYRRPGSSSPRRRPPREGAARSPRCPVLRARHAPAA